MLSQALKNRWEQRDSDDAASDEEIGATQSLLGQILRSLGNTPTPEGVEVSYVSQQQEEALSIALSNSVAEHTGTNSDDAAMEKEGQVQQKQVTTPMGERKHRLASRSAGRKKARTPATATGE